jgi:hypothetical protein
MLVSHLTLTLLRTVFKLAELCIQKLVLTKLVFLLSPLIMRVAPGAQLSAVYKQL